MIDEPRQPAAPAGLVAESVAAALIGAVVGGLCTFEALWRVHGLWAGVILAGVAATAVSAGLGHLLRGAAAPVAASVGWVVMAGYFSGGRPEGDVVVPGTGQGYAFLGAGIVGLGLGIWHGSRRGRRFTSAGSAPNNTV